MGLDDYNTIEYWNERGWNFLRWCCNENVHITDVPIPGAETPIRKVSFSNVMYEGFCVHVYVTEPNKSYHFQFPAESFAPKVHELTPVVKSIMKYAWDMYKRTMGL